MEARVLWLDDKVTGESYKEVLRDLASCNDFVVEPAADLESARRLVKDGDFAVLVVDLRLPGHGPEESGFAFIDWLSRRLAKSNNPQRPLVVALSAHLDQETYRVALQRYEIPMKVCDKDSFGATGLGFAEGFAALVRDVLDTGIHSTASDWVDQVESEAHDIDPFKISIHDYEKLPDTAKSLVYERGIQRAESVLDRKSKGDDIGWILMCGDAEEPLQEGRIGSPKPSDEVLTEIARSQDRVPFLISEESSLFVEDISIRSRCGEELSDYPVLHLVLGAAGKRGTYHFDTGSDVHLFQQADIVDAEIEFLHYPRSQRDPKKKKRYQVQRVSDFDAIAMSPESGETKHVEVRDALAVWPWENCPWTRRCSPTSGCVYETTDGGQVKIETDQLCATRDGLVGRRLLGDNGLSARLHGASTRVDLEESE